MDIVRAEKKMKADIEREFYGREEDGERRVQVCVYICLSGEGTRCGKGVARDILGIGRVSRE